MKKTILSSKAPKPIGPYNQAIEVDKLLFISGQLAIDPKQEKIIASDIASQTRQVMENIRAILEEANCSLGDIVQTTVYLSSMSLFDDFNREYAKFFKDNFPARATVGCELKAGALVEVAVTAYRG